MNLAALNHEPTLLFRQPLARNQIRFRLLTAQDDCEQVMLCFWKRTEPYPQAMQEEAMTVRYRDGNRKEWLCEITFPEEAHYIKYCFRLHGRKAETVWYCEHGFSQAPPQQGFFELLQVHETDVRNQPQWSQGLIYYQIFPERFAVGNAAKPDRDYVPWDSQPTRENYFGGDLLGIQQKLPYLAEVGVECLYLTPVFHGDFNHKYATTDYFQVDPDFGTNETLIALVDTAHRHGIRVMLDGVFNHVGTRFAPFADLIRNGEASAYRDWFYPKRFPIRLDPVCYECVGDYPYMPRLRVANPAVREYVLSVLTYWLRTAHIDGWRLDVADELDVQTLRYLRQGVKAEFPDALLLGETWADASRMINEGDQLDCAMNYLFREAMVDFFARGSIDAAALDHRLQRMLMKYPNEVNQAMYNCLSSHDTPRFLTEARNELWRLQLAMAFQILFIGSPAIYYGDELGMAGANDPGCRGGMAWKQQDSELRTWVIDLLALRKASNAVRKGSYRTLLAGSANPDLFCFERSDGQSRVIAVFNRGEQPYTADLADGVGTITVPPRSVKIIQ